MDQTELSKVEDTDGRVGRVGDGEVVAVLGERQCRNGRARLVRQCCSEGRLVPDVPDSNGSIDGTSSVEESVRVDGKGRVRVRALRGRQRLVRLDDLTPLEIEERPSRVERRSGRVGLGRVQSEASDVLLGDNDVVGGRPASLRLGKDLDLAVGGSRECERGLALSLSERNVGDLLGVALERGDNLARRPVVDLDQLVGSTGQDEAAVGRDVERCDARGLGGVERGDFERLSVGCDGGSVGVAGRSLALFSDRREAERGWRVESVTAPSASKTKRCSKEWME